MMGNAQKTHFARTMNRFAEQKVLDAMQTLGKSLPCHVVAVDGSIVTVRFDIESTFTLPDVTCPMFGPEYVRYPTQIGDKGVTMSADYYIGGISGLGGGVANLSLRANLSTLIWFPIASSEWSETDNPNALVLYGPDGAILRTLGQESVITVDPNKIESTSNGNTLTVDVDNVRTSGVLRAGNGASGTFGTVTVSHGIVTGGS